MSFDEIFEPQFDAGLDEIWRDFYATEKKKAVIKSARQLQREKYIRIAWLYDQVAATGTKTPVDDLALKIGITLDEAAELVGICLELQLLLTPKSGAFRCELSKLAQRMIAQLGDYP